MHRKELNCDYPEYICSTAGHKRRKLGDLTVEERIEVADDLIVQKDYHDNICARYSIGRESIKTLLKNMKKDPQYLHKVHQ